MKIEMKIQKIVMYILLAVSAVSFFLALGLVTDIYKVVEAQTITSAFGFTIDKNDCYHQIQDFNDKLVFFTIIAILLSALLFLLRCHSRRIYHISNYIGVSLVALTITTLGIIAIKEIVYYKNLYLSGIDFSAWKETNDLIIEFGLASDLYYSESTLWLDLNIYAMATLIIASWFIVFTMVGKIILEMREKKLLSLNQDQNIIDKKESEVNAHE